MANDDLRTVAHYPSAAEAALARNRLLDAGIHATVADEYTLTMDPLLSGAVNFIKLQVRADELQRAAELLDLEAPAVDAAETDDQTPPEADEALPLESKGEALVRYAARAAVLGAVACFFLPILQVYSLVQLLRVALYYSDLPPRANRVFYATLVFNVAVIGFWLLVWRWMLTGPHYVPEE